MGKFGGWVGKVACWGTEAAISLKRVKIEEKLLWRAYRNSQTLFRTVPSPYGLLFPNFGGSQPPPKLQSLLSQEQVKLRASNLDGTFTGPIGKKFNISGKVAVDIFRESRKFSGHPHRAHRAVIFAVAQLSCFLLGCFC